MHPPDDDLFAGPSRQSHIAISALEDLAQKVRELPAGAEREEGARHLNDCLRDVREVFALGADAESLEVVTRADEIAAELRELF